MKLIYPRNKGFFYGVVLILLIILTALTIIAFTPVKSSPEKIIQLPQKTEISPTKIIELANCDKIVPLALQSINKTKHNVSYGLDGSSQSSTWAASSKPPEKFSLRELPTIFFVYNQQSELQGCGTSSLLTSEKVKALESEMKQIQCGEETRFFATGKDGAQPLQILMPNSTIVSLIYRTDMEINQENLICK